MTALVLAFVLSASGAVDVDTRLREAQQLAARQESSAAIDAYRNLITDGVDGAGLRYNLGTLLLETGDLGGGIQQLLTARRLAPLDEDVAHNLAVAIEARADRLAGGGGASVVRLLGSRTPPLLARLAVAIPAALLGVLLILSALVGSRAVRALAVACAALTVLGLGLWACRLDVERTREAVVLVPEASARKEPDAAAAESFLAHAGLSGIVVDDQGAWVRLRMDNGLEAWLERSALGFVGDAR